MKIWLIKRSIMLQDHQCEFYILWIKLTRHKRLSQHQSYFAWRKDPEQGAQCPRACETQTQSVKPPSLRNGNRHECRPHHHREAAAPGLPPLKYLASPLAPVGVCLAPIRALAVHQWRISQQPPDQVQCASGRASISSPSSCSCCKKVDHRSNSPPFPWD